MAPAMPLCHIRCSSAYTVLLYDVVHVLVASAREVDEDGTLAHFLREQALPEHVVYLVRAGVVEILALEVYLRAAKILSHFVGVVQQLRSAGVLPQKRIQLVVEVLVVLVELVCLLQLMYLIHQRFGDILSAEFAVTSV